MQIIQEFKSYCNKDEGEQGELFMNAKERLIQAFHIR